ncbi:MAG: RsmE family RNA methyltransferase [Flavobacteriales bacterium]
MNLFYHANSLENERVVLDPADAIHLTKVLRMKDGAQIHMTNGLGDLFDALVVANGRNVEIEVLKKLPAVQTAIQLEMVVAPTKNQDRLEWFVEKAVEIGVGKIRLITAEHSERSHIRMDRLQRVAIAAMKQSLKLYLPEIVEPVDFKDWMPSANGTVCIAHCRENPARQLLRDVLTPGEPATIAIGPEGDFAVSELAMAMDAGFIPVSLGNSRLRTETAAICAVHTFELINQMR